MSVSGSLMRVSPALHELAERSTDRSANRQDEPYRRAIGGIYSRLAATARELDQVVALAAAAGRGGALWRGGGVSRRSRHDRLLAGRKRRGHSGARAVALACVARSIVSASISRRSTCGRIRTCMSGPSRNCSRRRLPASNISRSAKRRASRCCCRNCARRARSSRPSSPIARKRRANSRFSAPPPGFTRPMARRRSAPASSPRRKASPTCWSWRCC